jgi:membrane-bound ClpP family serine protease
MNWLKILGILFSLSGWVFIIISFFQVEKGVEIFEQKILIGLALYVAGMVFLTIDRFCFGFGEVLYNG